MSIHYYLKLMQNFTLCITLIVQPKCNFILSDSIWSKIKITFNFLAFYQQHHFFKDPDIFQRIAQFYFQSTSEEIVIWLACHVLFWVIPFPNSLFLLWKNWFTHLYDSKTTNFWLNFYQFIYPIKTFANCEFFKKSSQILSFTHAA